MRNGFATLGVFVIFSLVAIGMVAANILANSGNDFVSNAYFSGPRISSKNQLMKCNTTQECADTICPAVIGSDTPICNVNIHKCSCGPKPVVTVTPVPTIILPPNCRPCPPYLNCPAVSRGTMVICE